MARKSLSAQFAELREYTAKLEIELAGFREIAARKSNGFKARLQSRSDSKNTPQSRSEAAREYCKQHGVSSVSKQQLDAWMN